jgi:hypothetical protein
MVAPLCVFWYLNDTKDLQLGVGGEVEGAVECYVDSDYAGCPDDLQTTSGLIITFRGAVDSTWRKQRSTAQSTTNAEYYAFEVGCIRLNHISHHSNMLSIPTIPHVFSVSQSLIISIKNRIYSGNALTHIANKYNLAEDQTRDGGIDLSYVPTASQSHCRSLPAGNKVLQWE